MAQLNIHGAVSQLEVRFPGYLVEVFEPRHLVDDRSTTVWSMIAAESHLQRRGTVNTQPQPMPGVLACPDHGANGSCSGHLHHVASEQTSQDLRVGGQFGK